ncbi:MAG: Re/Si-specific NAD(P)(+) transhydrogenase subunit alpha [Armatimonadetes bacterium]|nr:Re/Si-specific NAD(P)(+) transhydrogenase subunit alpha [Armatimonadota bacterium]
MELSAEEARVALTPDSCKALIDKGFKIIVQSGAGVRAGFFDPLYESVGAQVVPDAKSVFDGADLVAKVLPPTPAEVKGLKPGSMVLSFLYAGSNKETVQALASGKVTCFAMELIPRITRAQSMDALSSMSTIAGYKAVLKAADALPKFFPMFMTAAGTLPPAKAIVLGAGVAGLQAIATCKRLGAIVEAFDVRPAVKEQVESLGARFVSMPEVTAEGEGGYAKELSQDQHAKELEVIGQRLAKNDICITTALIPGRAAPVLITKDMLKNMAHGSVIVDLAAVAGGNCEATVPGKTVVVDGVTIMGPLDLLSEMAPDASKMYGRNILEFLVNLAPGGELNLNMEDEIISGTIAIHDGAITHESVKKAVGEVAA